MNLTGLTRKQYGDAMGSLRQNLQSLVDDYLTAMSEPFEPKEDW
jgi:hypothetical protein